MSSPATVTPIRPSLTVVERQVADIDDGYTRIANELLEAVMAADLTARQLKVVLAVIRKTYGFGKKLDRITNTQIAMMTGIHHTHVCKAKNEMIAMNIIISNGHSIGVNKVISDWNFDISHVGKSLAETANQTLANSANGYKPSQLNTKETIQKKEKKEHTQSSCDDHEPVKPEKRKAVKFDYDEYLNAYNEIVGDRLPHAVEANKERQRKIRELVNSLATKNIDGFRAYVKAFMSAARPFHFGDNDRDWVANFDYLLRPKVLIAIREGTL
ncbi:replication protein [Enterobacter kobei]|uniref:replication protein n=1 Tax=Enterobacter kobei TaxID=208224 RepID=UPI0011EBBEC1|nr:replication protein [Enterobacter kobei]ELQ3772959.1 replication protein [Enterobacter kobei]QEO02527.1 replication protein [Enterobacter kobei]